MEQAEKIAITVKATINAPAEKVWQLWTTPENIVHWNHALETWHTPHAENNLRQGGKFSYRMEAKDGSMGFDFWGTYDAIIPHRQISSTLGDGRKLEVRFSEVNNTTEIIETFEIEDINSVEMQRNGWQAILDNFKRYVEAQ